MTVRKLVQIELARRGPLSGLPKADPDIEDTSELAKHSHSRGTTGANGNELYGAPATLGQPNDAQHATAVRTPIVGNLSNRAPGAEKGAAGLRLAFVD
jgi:hypothetical protein